VAAQLAKHAYVVVTARFLYHIYLLDELNGQFLLSLSEFIIVSKGLCPLLVIFTEALVE